MGKPKRRKGEGGTGGAGGEGPHTSTRTRTNSKGLSIKQLVIAFIVLAFLNYVAMHFLFSRGTTYHVTGDVEIKTLPSPKTKFAKECAMGREPIVVRNSVVELWKARKKWNPGYLESKLRILSGIYENDNRWFGPYYDSRKPLTNFSTRANPYRTNLKLSGKQFFNRIQNPNEGSYLYFTGGIDDLGEWAEGEVQPLQELLTLNPSRSSINVWIGQPHVIAHCHYDGYHNFYAQLYGTKRFTMFKPTNWPGLYPYPFLHPSHAQAQVNLSDASDFPLVGKVEAVEVVLEPGDMLYMPPLWFHYVESLDVSISVNVWTDSKQTEIMENVFSLPLPIDAIKWTNTKTRTIAASVLIYSMLQSVCQWKYCVSAASDKFLDQDNDKISDKSLYFIHRLWSTRYRTLMERGGHLPSTYSNGDILCESGGNGEQLLAEEAVSALEEVDFREYAEGIGHMARSLPEETWELWIGNYVEYIVANVVNVKYVGVFLKQFASCLRMV